MREIRENIKVLEYEVAPLSAEIIGIEKEDHSILIDCGTTPKSLEYIDLFKTPRTLILTSWHPDHAFNESCVIYDKLYVSHTTQTQLYKGEAVTSTIEIEPGITIYPIVSCNDKDILVVQVDDILFLQDALYKPGIGKFGKQAYDLCVVEQLKEFIQNSQAHYFCISYDETFMYSKEEILKKFSEMTK
ncbi:MAG: hypothetical protein Q4C49_01380 [Bacillota bacterium]|nr:hypothetical protein [Bacillota bacterium]